MQPDGGKGWGEWVTRLGGHGSHQGENKSSVLGVKLRFGHGRQQSCSESEPAATREQQILTPRSKRAFAEQKIAEPDDPGCTDWPTESAGAFCVFL